MKQGFEWLVLTLKGIGMGAANVIPGVSGGTIAFITGIYERLVGAINNFDKETVALLLKGKFKEFWKHIDGSFLVAILLGVAIATFSLAKLMVVLLANYPIPTWAFFFGLIIASSILMLADVKEWKAADFAFLVLGGLLGVAICMLPEIIAFFKGGEVAQTVRPSWQADLPYIFLCGAISICAMILPGISGSFILLIMGRYEYIMTCIDNVLHFDGPSFVTVVVFALGAATGILAFAKLLHWLLGKWNRPTMLLLTGFVMGSLVKIWPWADHHTESEIVYDGNPHILAAIIWCVLGVALVLGLEFLGKKMKKDKE